MATKWSEGLALMEERRKNIPATHREFQNRLARQCFDFFNLSKGGRVLDIGCGSGDKAPFVLERAREYIGVDVRLAQDHPPNLIEANGERLPFHDGEFDAVLSYSVLQHVENPDVYLSEARRVLKPGGTTALSVSLDGNPMFMRRFLRDDALALVGRYFKIEASAVVGNAQNSSLVIRAKKLSFEEAWKYSGNIMGWYEEPEAKLLWDCGLQCLQLGPFVEIGAYCGRTTTVLAQLKPSKLIVVDPFILETRGQNSLIYFRESMSPYPYELFQCRTENLPTDFDPRPGLLHIDGDHGAGIWTDCRYLLPMLVKGGIAVFHDWAHADGKYREIAKAVAAHTAGWEKVGAAQSALAMRKV